MTINQIALLRGINVGRSKRLAMSDLRALIEELGYQNVRTILNSGNAVFTAQGRDAAHSSKNIEEALFMRTGLSTKVTVLTADEINEIVSNNPFGEIAKDPSRLIIAVFRYPENREQIVSLQQQSWTPEALAVGARAAYLWCPDGVLASRIVASFNQRLGDNVTSRNWSTFLKIYAITSKDQCE